MDALDALDKAAGLINRALGDGRPRNGGGDDDASRRRAKWVEFKATARAQRAPAPRATAATLPGRSLPAYLALPVADYSLLDPAWVTRVEGGDDNADVSDAFIVALPLSDAVGVALSPTARVRVMERGPGVMQFVGDRLALGEAALDDSFDASVSARLASSAGGASGRRPHTDDASDHAHDHLAATVTLRARVRLRGSAAAIPGPMLRLAAKLVARAALGAALPGFLDMLTEDYGRWAAGEAREWVARREE